MRRRVFPVITATTALISALVLSGCTTAGSALSCEAPLSPGALSESVKISGDSAESLRISVNGNLTAMNAQRSVVIEGEDRSAPVRAGSIVEANFAYVDAVSGEILEVSPGFGSGSGDSLFVADPAGGSMLAGTVCAAKGDTVAVALTEEESAAMGVQGSLIFIAEIADVFGDRATGALRALPSGFPAVTTNDDGQPGIVLPPQQAPNETRSAIRIEGSGDTVTAEQLVVGQVLTVSWDGSLERNTWNSGATSFGTEADMENTGMTFRAELTGYPIGSQVIVVEGGDAPRVSVVDILAATA